MKRSSKNTKLFKRIVVYAKKMIISREIIGG